MHHRRKTAVFGYAIKMNHIARVKRVFCLEMHLSFQRVLSALVSCSIIDQIIEHKRGQTSTAFFPCAVSIDTHNFAAYNPFCGLVEKNTTFFCDNLQSADGCIEGIWSKHYMPYADELAARKTNVCGAHQHRNKPSIRLQEIFAITLVPPTILGIFVCALLYRICLQRWNVALTLQRRCGEIT